MLAVDDAPSAWIIDTVAIDPGSRSAVVDVPAASEKLTAAVLAPASPVVLVPAAGTMTPTCGTASESDPYRSPAVLVPAAAENAVAE